MNATRSLRDMTSESRCKWVPRLPSGLGVVALVGSIPGDKTKSSFALSTTAGSTNLAEERMPYACFNETTFDSLGEVISFQRASPLRQG